MPVPGCFVDVRVLARIRLFIAIPAFPTDLVVPVLDPEIISTLPADQFCAPGIHTGKSSLIFNACLHSLLYMVEKYRICVLTFQNTGKRMEHR
jgi:hypothetical protein